MNRLERDKELTKDLLCLIACVVLAALILFAPDGLWLAIDEWL